MYEGVEARASEMTNDTRLHFSMGVNSYYLYGLVISRSK